MRWAGDGKRSSGAEEEGRGDFPLRTTPHEIIVAVSNSVQCCIALCVRPLQPLMPDPDSNCLEQIHLSDPFRSYHNKNIASELRGVLFKCMITGGQKFKTTQVTLLEFKTTQVTLL